MVPGHHTRDGRGRSHARPGRRPGCPSQPSVRCPTTSASVSASMPNKGKGRTEFFLPWQEGAVWSAESVAGSVRAAAKKPLTGLDSHRHRRLGKDLLNIEGQFVMELLDWLF